MIALRTAATVLLNKEKNVTVETHLQRSDDFYMCYHNRRHHVHTLGIVRWNLPYKTSNKHPRRLLERGPRNPGV